MAVKGLSRSRNRLALAKELYLQYVDEKRIEAETGFKHRTLLRYFARWEKKRTEQSHRRVAEKLEAASEGISSIIQLSIPLIHDGLKWRAESGVPLQIKEMKDLSDIISNMDKILRLDAGKPTDIQQTHLHAGSITLEELKNAIETDGFLGAIPLKSFPEEDVSDAEIIRGPEDTDGGSSSDGETDVDGGVLLPRDQESGGAGARDHRPGGSLPKVTKSSGGADNTLEPDPFSIFED